jgi:hypothetical protein
MRAGHGVGVSLIANGQASNGSKLICSHGIFYDKSLAKKKNEVKKEDYRPATLNAVYRNDRDDGRTLQRHTSTGKPQMEKGQSTCKWKLAISCDEHGFYMHCGIGCGEHTGHPPPLDAALETTRRRLPEQNDKETQLQPFLQKAPKVESLKPRLALKASIDELLSVIEGSNRPQDHVEKVLEWIREFTADVRAKCHEQNTDRKRSAIVSYNQEREPKKCRQLVANHGIR